VKLTYGVAMCTYNGESYLKAQLESILLQNKKPDMIVICDDYSSDATWEILEEFKAKAQLPVIIFRNDVRQGVIRNFERAVSSLTTDVIFLCDQDDIWLPDKVAKVSSIFESSPEISLIFSDAILIDENAEHFDHSLFERLGVTRKEKEGILHDNALAVLLRRNIITGATAAFRRSLLPLALPFPETHYHDEWLGFIAAATSRIKLIPEPTIKYRLHGKNVVGVKKMTTLDVARELWWDINKPPFRYHAKDRLKYQKMILDRMKDIPKIPDAVIRQCRVAVDFAKFRNELPATSLTRYPAILWRAAIGQYRRNEFHWKRHVCRDLVNR